MSAARILITNVHSAYNAGDLALLEMAVRQLSEVFEGAELSAVANWPDEPGLAHLPLKVLPSPHALVGRAQGAGTAAQILRGLRGYLLSRRAAKTDRSEPLPPGWRELLEAYRQADLVVGVGGNQFYSTGRYGWPLPLTALQVELAHLFGKPFYTMPQSLGPLRRPWERALMRRIYGRARKVFLRDAVSLRLAEEIGIPAGRLGYAPDPAFAYPAAGEEAARERLRAYGWQPGGSSIGATVIASMGRSLAPGRVDFYYQVMAKVLAQAARELDARIYLFIQVSGPTAVENDRTGSLRVLDLLPEDVRGRVVLVDEALRPDMLKACYGQMDAFLATRLHSGIFSLGMRVPTIFIGYLTKSLGVLQSLGIGEWCLPLGELDAPALWQALRQAWEERPARRAYLEQAMPEVEQQAGQTGADIFEDWSRLPR